MLGEAATSSDVLFLPFISLGAKDYHLQTGCPSSPSALEGPRTPPCPPQGSAARCRQERRWVSQAG